MKKLFILMLMCAVALPLFATGTPESTESYLDAKRNETLIVGDNSGFELTNMNPFIPTTSGGALYQTEDLFFQNQGTGKIEGWIGDSYTSSADFKQWKVKIKKTVYWSDGTKFNVDDILAHFDLIKRFKEASLNPEFTKLVKELRKVNDYEFDFVLNNPDPYFHITFLSNNRYFSAAPKRVLDKITDLGAFTNMGDFQGDKLPIVTSAFFIGRSMKNRTEHIRNDDWWGSKSGFKPAPKMKKVVLTYIGNRDVTLQAAIENKLDTIPFGLLAELKAIQAKNPEWEGYSKEQPGWEDMALRFLMFNTECPPPWNDADMRKMLQLVIDKKTLAELSSGLYGPATSVFPGYRALEKFDSLVSAADKKDLAVQDLDRAGKILESKGYKKEGGKWMKDGKQLSLEIISPEYPDVFVTGEVLAEQLIRFGINTTNKKMAGGPWGEALYSGDFTAAPGWHFLGALYEPYSTLKRATIEEYKPVGERATRNVWRYNNKAYTDAVNRLALISPDSAEALQLTKTALDLVFKDLFVIPLHKNYFIYMNNQHYWTNWTTKANSYAHPDMWTLQHVTGLKATNKE